MKNLFLFIVLPFYIYNVSAQGDLKMQVGATLDAWQKAAADANYNGYFDALTDDAVFIGTDATEHWNKTAFQA